MKGCVFDIKEFAVFDGPGIRTTVFMKGCPLHCEWCHNPEGLSFAPQLMVSTASCTGCGACERVCRHKEGCIACGECIPACRGGFRRICGEYYEAEALIKRLVKDKDVYQLSGGGVTFSGGEPLAQWEFVKNVILALKGEGISCAVETSACVSDEVFGEAAALCDLILVDWKVSDGAVLRRTTGADISVIRRHIELLANGTTPFILRLPIIPGINDNRAHFEAAAALVENSKALRQVDILPYQRAAGAKYSMVNKKYAPDFDESVPPQMFTEVFERRGIPFVQFR